MSELVQLIYTVLKAYKINITKGNKALVDLATMIDEYYVQIKKLEQVKWFVGFIISLLFSLVGVSMVFYMSFDNHIVVGIVVILLGVMIACAAQNMVKEKIDKTSDAMKAKIKSYWYSIYGAEQIELGNDISILVVPSDKLEEFESEIE